MYTWLTDGNAAAKSMCLFAFIFCDNRVHRMDVSFNRNTPPSCDSYFDSENGLVQDYSYGIIIAQTGDYEPCIDDLNVPLARGVMPPQPENWCGDISQDSVGMIPDKNDYVGESRSENGSAESNSPPNQNTLSDFSINRRSSGGGSLSWNYFLLLLGLLPFNHGRNRNGSK